MQEKLRIGYNYIYFSRWSKKGYAVFASLGKEVKISRLALHMYGNVLLKSSANGVIVNIDREADYYPKWRESGAERKLFTENSKGELCPFENRFIFG